MDTERQFRRIFLAFLVPFLAIRIAARSVSWLHQPKPKERNSTTVDGLQQRWQQLTTHETQASVAARIAFGPLLLLFGALYFVAPRWAQRFAVPLPVWLRWVGAGFGFASLPLLAWTHVSLGRAWSANLELQQQQQLVTGGPYRWVRHPMYTAVSAFMFGSTLVSANGGIAALAGVAFWIMLGRMGDEEAMMIEQFGEAYRAYTARTGRLLPKVQQ